MTEILILLLAIYYIIKIRIFLWRQAVIALLLGGICLISLFRDPRTADIIITSICVAVTFYAGCRLYERANVENASIHIGGAGSIRLFALWGGRFCSVGFFECIIFFVKPPDQCRKCVAFCCFCAEACDC